MRFIKLDENNIVMAIRNGKAITKGEIQSDVGEIGQGMKIDGVFITPEPEISEGKVISKTAFNPVTGEFTFEFTDAPLTPEEDRDAMLIDQEYRLTLLELGVM